MSETDQYTGKPTSGTVTVANDAQLSDAYPLHGTTLVAFETPAAITGTTYTFHGSIDNGQTYVEVRNQLGSAIAFTGVTASGVYPLDPRDFIAFDKIKVNTGTNEGAERVIKLKAFAI